MVKRQHYTGVDRYMTEYRMRTCYASPRQINRLTPDQQSARSTQRHSAHDKSHLKNNPPEAFYHSEGRIDKNSRMKKSTQQPNQIKTHATVTTTPKKSSCCTIL